MGEFNLGHWGGSPQGRGAEKEGVLTLWQGGWKEARFGKGFKGQREEMREGEMPGGGRRKGRYEVNEIQNNPDPQKRRGAVASCLP